MFSEIFASVVLAEYGKIALLDWFDDKIKLVVRDIFDKSKYYEAFELDFSPIANPINALQDITFLDKDTVEISYLSGNEFNKKTVILQLNY